MAMIRVLPASQDMLKHLKHPSGVKFTDMKRPVDWPADGFTTRRIRDGDVVVIDNNIADRPLKKIAK